MGILAVGLGAALIAAGVIDLVWTTLASSGGGGPLTGRVTAWLWRRLVPDGDVEPDHGWLRIGGLGVLLSVLAIWIALFVVGWWLIFHGAAHAVVDSQTSLPANVWQRLYFVMFTLSTLGMGDYVPGGDVWRVLAGAASAMGLMFATLSISYLVPVLQAVTQRRTLALTISSLGRNPQQIVTEAIREDEGAALTRQLIEMNSPLSQLAQQHLSYPVLHHFHDVSVQAAGAVQLAVLDETLTLLRAAIDGDAGPDRRAVSSLRHTMEALLQTLTGSHIRPAEEPPPLPDLTPLREAGLPVVDDETFVARMAALQPRRRALRGFVEDDGWSWDDVYRSPDQESEFDPQPET